uniref:Cell division cycle protein 27 homolog n=1 Tax=Timema cristinae TaxID=61476 RepID=A0A7R9CAP0_TIMCR|nr:unnamed protein product [Timema cristinae]
MVQIIRKGHIVISQVYQLTNSLILVHSSKQWIKAAIWHCLNHYAYQDAIFLAERLFAEVVSDETVFLLATCYYRSGKPGQAYSILRSKGVKSPQCRYLLAKCCMDLENCGNKRISEAEAAITGGDLGRPRSVDEIVSHFGEQACFVLLIFARICLQTERSEKASEAYRKALKLNPFLWHAFEELCNRGEKPDPVRTFHVSNFDNFSMCHGVNPVVNFANSCEHNVNLTCSSQTFLVSRSFNVQVSATYATMVTKYALYNTSLRFKGTSLLHNQLKAGLWSQYGKPSTRNSSSFLPYDTDSNFDSSSEVAVS